MLESAFVGLVIICIFIYNLLHIFEFLQIFEYVIHF